MAAEQTEPGQTNEKMGTARGLGLKSPGLCQRLKSAENAVYFFSISFVFNVSREPIADVYSCLCL